MEKAGITIFFTFLKYNLGGKEEMNKVIADIDWKQLYVFSSNQAILGLCFYGIEKLGNEYSEELKRNPIERELMMTWMGATQQIRRHNMKVNAVASKFLPDGIGEIAIPTMAFNVVYQLTHLCHHFFDEGIGMRQIIDYYYVVSMLNVNCEMLTWLPKELKYMGLWKFAGAVMYVLHEALGLSEEKMIAPMDEKRGKLLLAEILNGGNFGQHFTKYGHFTQQGMAKKYFLKIWRNMHFVMYYPAEALSEPIFRTWHFFWRMKNKK